MADAPWRCSECGTINEPVANACRTCGRWPSLFDLQESLVEDVELEVVPEQPTVLTQTVEVEALEVPSFEEPEPFEVDSDDNVEAEAKPSRWRGAATAIPPLVVLIWIVVSALLNR